MTADWMSLKGQEPPAPAGIDVSVPHSARIELTGPVARDHLRSPAQLGCLL